MQKPWLLCIILEQLARQVGAAARSSQKRAEKIAGKGAFPRVFEAADVLCLEIKAALTSIEASQASPSDVESSAFEAHADQVGRPQASSNDSDAPSPPYEEALAEYLASETSSPATPRNNDHDHAEEYDSARIEALVEDRLRCIAPQLRADIIEPLSKVQTEHPMQCLMRRPYPELQPKGATWLPIQGQGRRSLLSRLLMTGR